MLERRHEAMAWIHTWLGLACGFIFLVILFTGSITVFRPELDRWMNPALRHVAPAGSLDLDGIAAVLEKRARPRRHRAIHLPSSRMPAIQVSYFSKTRRGFVTDYLEPTTLEPLEKISGGGSWLFDELHNKLFILPFGSQGRKLVAIVSIVALAVMISGIWIHKGHFRKLFVLRPKGGTGRALVDLHTTMSLIALPFHLLLTVSGIWIIGTVLLPHGIGSVYDTRSDFFHDAYGNFERQATQEDAPMTSVNSLLDQAVEMWGTNVAGQFSIGLAGDRNAFVTFQTSPDNRLTEAADKITFDGVTGELLERESRHPFSKFKSLMDGLHRAAFRSYSIRWLYFVLGLAGSAMVATGLLFWLEKRTDERETVFFRLTAGATAGVVLGLPIASAGMLLANRLLPAGFPRREVAEVLVFFGIWGAAALGALVYAFLRSGRLPWRALCVCLSATSLAAAVANWATTGDHPLAGGPVGAVLGTDLVLLATAALAFWSARRLATKAS